MSSGETTPVLTHLDLPVGPGTRLTIWTPAGNPMLTKPLAEGDGFTIATAVYKTAGCTVDAGGGRWRAELLYWKQGIDGTELILEIKGRYGEDQNPV